MSESILHYVWQHKLFSTPDLRTTNNDKIEIIDVGKRNSDAGPDFFNAKIKIGETVWTGNVEIHKLSSDWNRHQHQHDKAYDSVILHVVEKADKPILRINNTEIPQMELKIPSHILENYESLQQTEKWIACENKINTVPAIFINSWKNTLLTERLEQKTQTIKSLLDNTNNHWEECFYITLARNFGFGTNGQPFEALAKSLPLNIIGKHKNNLLQIEALLFGQAALLPGSPADEYTLQLKKEYDFLAAKYKLTKLVDASQWKLLRLRPTNFPHVRIAQLASLIHSSSKLFSKILEKPEIEYLKTLFNCETSPYWKTHYSFGKESDSLKSGKIGKQSITVILINTVVPFIFLLCFDA